jgi:dTDP-4-dehydrorhamnose 3,5-epimerase
MKLVEEPLPGIKVFEPFVHRDARGEFVKPYHEEKLREYGIDFVLREEFFSISAKGVIRGMHFQCPPAAHAKWIYCISGSALDVVLDLRKNSPSFGRSVGVELTATNRRVIYIPIGFAHGFASLEDGTCLVYKTDHVHAPDAEAGIFWDSFGFEWPFDNPVVSARDAGLPRLAEFSSPF